MASDSSYTVEYGYTQYSNGKRVSSVTEKAGSTIGQTVGFTYQNHRFDTRTSGLDDIYGTSDDIVTTVLFDHLGRATCTYSTNTSSSICYGSSLAEYTDFTRGDRGNHKLKSSAVQGTIAENLIPDGSFETSSWIYETNGTGYSVSRLTSASFSGRYSYKLSSSTSGVTGYAQISKTVTIPTAGTYTLSAYIKTVAISGGGAYMVFDGKQSSYVTGTTNPAIQNGWQRISIKKTFTSAGTYTVQLRLLNAKGTAYFDCVQLEKSETPSDFNFVTNSSVRGTSGWAGTFSTVETEAQRGHVGVITGSVSDEKSVSQTITVNAKTNTTFMLSGWARANSVLTPTQGKADTAYANGRTFGLLATLAYSDGSKEEHYAPFNSDLISWQYTSLVIAPKKKDDTLTVSSIKVAVVYDKNANTMFFDDICLIVEPAQTYAYDENGNLKSTTDRAGNDSLMTYVNNDVKTYTTPTGDRYEYTYYKLANGTDTHDVETTKRTLNGITQTLTYGYDAYGNVTSTNLTVAGITETFSSSATYDEHGNFLKTVTDSLGNVTTYDYDTVTKLLNYVQDANGNQTRYGYDTRHRTQNVYLDADNDGVIDTTEASVEYLYAQNRLSSIETATNEYKLTYDGFGNLKTVKAGSNTLATYNFAAGNGKLTSLTYGNGDYETYTYDRLDRLTKVVYNGNANSGYELIYDANGRLYQTIDYEGNISHIYEYDSLDRLIRAQQVIIGLGTTALSVENAYDEYGRASGSTYAMGGVTQDYDILYQDTSGLIDSYTAPHNTFSYLYDEFDRLEKKTGSNYSIQYTYKNGSTLVDTYNVAQRGGPQTTYAYTYDNLGNITSISKNGTVISNYEYDKLGQLIREDDCANNVCWVYTYDNAGNLQKKYEFPGTGPNTAHWLGTYPAIGEIVSTYGYSTSEWGDLLTNYNGTTITYDAIGNPLKWRNATSMSWDRRSLQSMTLTNGTSVTFGYNADGIRTQKKVGSTTHEYLLDGSTILRERIYGNGSTSILYYYYDESGISGISYN